MILIPELQIILIFFSAGKHRIPGVCIKGRRGGGKARSPGAFFIRLAIRFARARTLEPGEAASETAACPGFFFCPDENKDRKRKSAGRPGLFTGVSPLKKFKPGKIHRFLRISGME